jgi:CCR4-NOT transcriptional complex subunit CAF120
MLQIFMSNRPKDKRAPVLTMRDITQAFAVYPERPEMMTVSTLMKLEGLLGDEAAAGGMRSREAWIMVMPETDGKMPSTEMLKWVMGEFKLFVDDSGFESNC